MTSKQSSFLNRVMLVIKPQERGLLTKGGEMDDSLCIDESDFPGLGTKLLSLRAQQRRGRKVFSLKPGEFRQQFMKATVQLNLQDHMLTNCQARQGGASRDALLRRREWSAIKKRGRWKTDTAMKRYEKHGRLQQLLAHTPRATYYVVVPGGRRQRQGLAPWCAIPRGTPPATTASSRSRSSAAVRVSPERSLALASLARPGTT